MLSLWIVFCSPSDIFINTSSLLMDIIFASCMRPSIFTITASPSLAMNRGNFSGAWQHWFTFTAFFIFAQREQQREADALIKEENLNEEAAKRYIRTSLKREYATENGTELNETLPKLSPLNPQYKTKKQSVFQKIVAFIEKFKGVGGQI